MGVEFERKYLVIADDWRDHIEHSDRIVQGYLAITHKASVRVRVARGSGTLTVKSANMIGISRIEVESVISVADAEQLLSTLCEGVIEKERHFLRRRQQVWTVDVFAGQNSRLTLLEVEGDREFLLPDLPSWVGLEVTDDSRYQNSYLSENPYNSWAETDGSEG